jgi:hypothetical protein
MPSDRVVVVEEPGPRRPRRRRRLLVGVHAAVLASIALTSGALASGSSSSDSNARSASTAPKPADVVRLAPAHHGCHRLHGMRPDAGARF